MARDWLIVEREVVGGGPLRETVDFLRRHSEKKRVLAVNIVSIMHHTGAWADMPLPKTGRREGTSIGVRMLAWGRFSEEGGGEIITKVQWTIFLHVNISCFPTPHTASLSHILTIRTSKSL